MLLKAALYLVSVDIGFRLMGYAGLERLIATRGARQLKSVNHQHAHEYAYWVERAARKLGRRYQCLHRSLALHAWLRRSGVPSRIKIGVRKSGGDLAAHAWIEVDGKVVGEAPGATDPFIHLNAMPRGKFESSEGSSALRNVRGEAAGQSAARPCDGGAGSRGGLGDLMVRGV